VILFYVPLPVRIAVLEFCNGGGGGGGNGRTRSAITNHDRVVRRCLAATRRLWRIANGYYYKTEREE